MLLFISTLPCGMPLSFKIQIHLMLLFIFVYISATRHIFSFKYISCYYLSAFRIDCLPSNFNSNTSHVIIYRRRKKQRTADNHIQIHLMLLFINALLCLCCTFLTFKYISCYYLSNGSLISFGFVNIFKYISCYYLSIAGLPEEWREG